MARRWASFVLATSFVATGAIVASVVEPVATSPTASAAIGTTNIIFDRPGNTPVFGPNDLVEIYAGNINYIGGYTAIGEPLPVGACTASVTGTGRRSKPGADDYIQAYADIYIVSAGLTPKNDDDLKDLRTRSVAALQGKGSAVVGGLGGGFIYAPLAFTKPAANGLGAGTYGIVIDECQNGIFDLGEDSYFDNAFRVDLQQDVPLLNTAATAFTAMKARAARFNTGRQRDRRDHLSDRTEQAREHHPERGRCDDTNRHHELLRRPGPLRRRVRDEPL